MRKRTRTKPTAKPTAPSSSDANPNGPYFHGAIKKAKADEILLANGGAQEKGKFLFRSKGSSGDEFILSVVFKGGGTHHAVARDDVGSEFKLNKTPTGQTTLVDLTEYLREKRKGWPLALTTGVSP